MAVPVRFVNMLPRYNVGMDENRYRLSDEPPPDRNRRSWRTLVYWQYWASLAVSAPILGLIGTFRLTWLQWITFETILIGIALFFLDVEPGKVDFVIVRRRKPFQFGLGTLFAVTTIAAVAIWLEPRTWRLTMFGLAVLFGLIAAFRIVVMAARNRDTLV